MAERNKGVGRVTGLLHMFLFIAALFSVFVIYAYVDHKRLKSTAQRYIRSKLGLYGVDFRLARFVRMARIIQEEADRFIAVFPAHGRHLVIRGFQPGTVFDVPPDGAILSDEKRNVSWLFLEQKKQVYYSKLEGFIPGSACYVRRGAGKVVFGAEEIPGTIRDWFLIDRKNKKTGWLLQEPDALRQYRGFLLMDGFAPEEGELQDEGGRVILLDRARGKFALRDGSQELFRVYGHEDIESCRTTNEDGSDQKDVLELHLKGEKAPWRFDFKDMMEAARWRELLWDLSGNVPAGPPARRESRKLEPVPQDGRVF